MLEPLPRALLLGALTLCLAAPAQAQSLLDRDSAVRQALAAHPALRAGALRVEAARARAVHATAWPNPRLSLLADEIPIPSAIHGNFMLGMSQPLWLGPSLQLRQEEARLDIRLAELESESIVRDLAFEVLEAHDDLASRAASLALSEQERQAARDRHAASLKRLAAGEVAPSEVLQAELALAEAELDHLEAETAERQARARLNSFLARPPEAALSIRLAPPGPIPTLESLRARAIASRLDLQALGLKARREVIARQLAEAAVYASTELSGALGLVAGMPGLSGTLSWPLPLYRQQGEIREAEANQARYEVEQEALSRQVVLEVESAHRELTRAGQALAMVEAGPRARSEKLYQQARARFRLGEIDAIALNEARKLRMSAERTFLSARYAHARALTALDRASAAPLPTPGVSLDGQHTP